MKEIDFTPLTDFLKSAIQMPDIDLSISWPENAKRPTIICPNLVDHCGPFRSVLKDAALSVFGASPFGGTEGGGFWLSIILSYETHSGSNGINLADAWYYEKTQEWVFKPASQKH